MLDTYYNCIPFVKYKNEFCNQMKKNKNKNKNSMFFVYVK